MLQNDIGEENDNDGFIIPMTPMTPGTGDSPGSLRRTRYRGTSTGASSLDRTERGGEGFISYQRFLSGYWSHFPHSVTRVLGVYTAYPACSIGNRGTRSCFDFWRDSWGYQGFRGNYRHAAQVFRPRRLPIRRPSGSVSSRSFFPHEGDCI